jgi:hypothetical protein
MRGMRATAVALAVLAGVQVVGVRAAGACGSVEAVNDHFAAVMAGSLKRAPEMTPAEFTVWASYLDEFNQYVGRNDLASACEVLDDAARDLRLEVDEAPAGGTG